MGGRRSSKGFWHYVDRKSDDECWLWTGTTGAHFGYGLSYMFGKKRRAHRISYELHFGPIPAGMIVRHKCDVPACVNPAHLQLGTQAENRADCVARGRHAKGDNTFARKHPERLKRGDEHPMRIRKLQRLAAEAEV